MKKQILLLPILALTLAGCAMPTVKTTTKLAIQTVGTVAVLPFEGYNGNQFADAITQELMLHGVKVVERSRLMSVLLEQGLNVSQITAGSFNYEKIGGLLGVDTVVIGSVSPIIVYDSGAPSGKVSTASLRFVSVKNGTIIGAATYNANTELLGGSVLYPKAAERLVNELFE